MPSSSPHVVDEHLSAGDLEDGLARQGQPVVHRQVVGGVDAEARDGEVAGRLDLHPMAHGRVPRRGEPGGVAGERLGQPLGEVVVDVGDETVRDEEVEPQAPVVVARHRVVEPEDVGPAPETRCGTRHPGPVVTHEGLDDLLEVVPRQLRSGGAHAPDRASPGTRTEAPCAVLGAMVPTIAHGASRRPRTRMPPRPVGHGGTRQRGAGSAEVTNRARRDGAAGPARRR